MVCKKILLGQQPEACMRRQPSKNMIVIDGITVDVLCSSVYTTQNILHTLTTTAQLKPVQDTSL